MELTPATLAPHASAGDFSRGKIERSAEALRVRHHPQFLSLRKRNPAATPREQSRGQRNRKWPS